MKHETNHITRNLWKPLVLFIVILAGCKKDENPDIAQEAPAITSFSIESENNASTIDADRKTISVHIGNLISWEALKVNFTLSTTGQLHFDNEPLSSGTSTIDLREPVELALQSQDGTQTATWKIQHTSLLEPYGLGKWLERAKSLTSTADFYFDQGGTGIHELINCGPTVTTMALKWSDPTYTKTPEDARTAILPEGGWWYTRDITTYLTSHGINSAYVRMETELNVKEYGERLKSILDDGYAAILCLDMYYVAQELDESKRTNKFYQTKADEWGHFLLAKGYKEVDGTLWIEAYDPYSLGSTYDGTEQPKGKDRYYAAAELKKATDIWWPYTMAVAPKGRTISGVSVVPSQHEQFMFHQRGGVKSFAQP